MPESNEDSVPVWLRTAPLTHQELGAWFGISPRYVGELLGSIDGVEKVGRRWRVPVREMPPAYLLSIGLIIPSRTLDDIRATH
jgi:hypothetical protein